ncbi:hypothetical protein ABZ419_11395 [Streptomyces cinnamoneus]|uniref:hypothetical protein n=1 Tax=Streptomyces cinnamoneus TaxID=53446 RepID=UPI0033D6A5FD
MELGARLWVLIEDQGERLPLSTLGEMRAVVALLQDAGAGDGVKADVATELAARFARRLPAEE